jgi:hypothetical protein
MTGATTQAASLGFNRKNLLEKVHCQAPLKRRRVASPSRGLNFDYLLCPTILVRSTLIAKGRRAKKLFDSETGAFRQETNEKADLPLIQATDRFINQAGAIASTELAIGPRQ